MPTSTLFPSKRNFTQVNYDETVPTMGTSGQDYTTSTSVKSTSVSSIYKPLKIPTTTEYTNNTILAKTSIEENIPKKGFLVWTRECQIPDLDPFAPRIRMSFKKVKKPKCHDNPLTEITKHSQNGNPVLNFYSNLTKKYDNNKLDCCYNEIKRGSGSNTDSRVDYSKCINFNTTLDLNFELGSILVTCRNSKKRIVYANVHVLVPRNPSIDKRLHEWKTKDGNSTKPVNVILFGIDSVSRMNLLRVMPKTAKYVQRSGWFEMAGYNKVEDNTFPNLMSILTGYNVSNAYKLCNPKKVGGLDSCPFIWNDYQKAGYVTAYAEDTEQMSTFNYLKVGFKKQPTDYYLRPAMMAAEKNLAITKLFGLRFCLGFKSSSEYVYDYVTQVSQAYKDTPFFGLFWTNSFSHNAFESASVMDENIIEYFDTFNSSGLLDESIIIFFSDHGMRFGPLRLSPTGHLEERLPFFYVWLPPKFRDKNPDFVQALKINKHRLTTPYDLHLTLKHILKISGRVNSIEKARDCSKCQSLFLPIPESRSCEDAAIEDHWCTCRAFHNVDKQSPKVRSITQRTINYINDLVTHANNGSVSHLCKHLVLKKILYANQEVLPHEAANTTLEGYQLSFETNPGGAKFETTVRLDTKSSQFTVTGTISRLNSYSKQAKCVQVEAVKKYCAC